MTTAVLEAPQVVAPHKRPKTRSTWNKEQAEAARVKGLEVRRKNLAEAKRLKAEEKHNREADPCDVLRERITRPGTTPRAAVLLAEALRKLSSVPATVRRPKPTPGSSDISCASSPTMGGVRHEPAIHSTPQSTQVVESKVDEQQANFAQYPNTLIRGKESLNPGEGGVGVAGGGLQATGASGVLSPPLHTGQNPQTGAVLHSPHFPSALNSVHGSNAPRGTISVHEAVGVIERAGGRVVWGSSSESGKLVVGSAGPVSGSGVGASQLSLPPGCPGPGYEKVLVGGVWTWGRKNR